jgi:MutS domain V
VLDNLSEHVQSRAADFRAKASAVARTATHVSWLRLIVFAAAAGSCILAFTMQTPLATFALGLAIAALVVFALLVTYHDRLKARARDLMTLAELNDLAIQRIDRNWSQLPLAETNPLPDDHPYAADLDLFGPASLAQLFPPMTPLGRLTIREWLLELPPPPLTVTRQESVAELQAFVDFREAFAAHGMRHRGTPWTAPDTIGMWAATSPLAPVPASLLVAAGFLLACAAILGTAQAAGWISGYWWVVPLLIGRLLSTQFGTAADETITTLNTGTRSLTVWANLSRAIAAQPFQSTLLRRLQDDLGHGEDSAQLQIHQLQRLADWAATRSSPFLHFVLRTVVFWDLWIFFCGVRWRQRNGHRVPGWLAAIGACESLAALATLKCENPDWTFPTLAETPPARFVATAIGHPLLPRATRITNDLSLGPEGTLLLVTGSNMAGKSTLLRAVGLNLVLARVGSAVCASALEMTAFPLWTVIRVQDSLERGVSYFMAELHRLKQVVHAAKTQGPVLYLFDEILQGTNSAERLIAARRVLQHLMTAGAVGVVTTHDLSLADAETLEAQVRHVHFREHIDGAESGYRMTFDYRLRPGKATSTNALRLLELVGLTAAPS